jgi:predicted metal-dependent phosphoesterase TrpH
MAILKGNLHAHSTFSDGRFPVEEVVARYRDLGYDFLAITDHDDLIQPDYWLNLPSSDDRMIILPGVELDYRPLSQHVGKVTGDRETLHILNHPARYSLTVEQTLRRIRHISREWFPIHAVEMTDTGVYQPEYDVDAIGLPKVATDDSHSDDHIGRAWVEVNAARNPDAILRAIKAGDFVVGFGSRGVVRPSPRPRAGGPDALGTPLRR